MEFLEERQFIPNIQFWINNVKAGVNPREEVRHLKDKPFLNELHANLSTMDSDTKMEAYLEFKNPELYIVALEDFGMHEKRKAYAKNNYATYTFAIVDYFNEFLE